MHVARPEAVGQRLKITRLALGFVDQKEFYAPTRLGPGAFSMWESGDRYPRVEHAMLLCNEYGLTLDWIYRGDLSSLPHRLVIQIKNVILTLPPGSSEPVEFTTSENDA